jgi:hypothetical protein
MESIARNLETEDAAVARDIKAHQDELFGTDGGVVNEGETDSMQMRITAAGNVSINYGVAEKASNESPLPAMIPTAPAPVATPTAPVATPTAPAVAAARSTVQKALPYILAATLGPGGLVAGWAANRYLGGDDPPPTVQEQVVPDVWYDIRKSEE